MYVKQYTLRDISIKTFGSVLELFNRFLYKTKITSSYKNYIEFCINMVLNVTGKFKLYCLPSTNTDIKVMNTLKRNIWMSTIFTYINLFSYIDKCDKHELKERKILAMLLAMHVNMYKYNTYDLSIAIIFLYKICKNKSLKLT